MDKIYQDVHISIPASLGVHSNSVIIRCVKLVSITKCGDGFLKINFIREECEKVELLVPQTRGLAVTID